LPYRHCTPQHGPSWSMEGRIVARMLCSVVARCPQQSQRFCGVGTPADRIHRTIVCWLHCDLPSASKGLEADQIQQAGQCRDDVAASGVMLAPLKGSPASKGRLAATPSRHCVPVQQAGSTSIVEGEKEAWWLDDRTKRLFEQTMRLSGTLTFTVRPGTPLQLTREQARPASFRIRG